MQPDPKPESFEHLAERAHAAHECGERFAKLALANDAMKAALRRIVQANSLADARGLALMALERVYDVG